MESSVTRVRLVLKWKMEHPSANVMKDLLVSLNHRLSTILRV